MSFGRTALSTSSTTRSCGALHCSLISVNREILFMEINTSLSPERVSIPIFSISSNPWICPTPSCIPVPKKLGFKRKFFFWVNKEYAFTVIFSSNKGCKHFVFAFLSKIPIIYLSGTTITIPDRHVYFTLKNIQCLLTTYVFFQKGT